MVPCSYILLSKIQYLFLRWSIILKKIYQTTWEDFFLFKIYDFQETGGDESDGIYVPESKKETPWEQGAGDG